MDTLEPRRLFAVAAPVDAGSLGIDAVDAEQAFATAPLGVESVDVTTTVDEVAGKMPCPCCGGNLHGTLSVAAIDSEAEFSPARHSGVRQDFVWTGLDSMPMARGQQSYLNFREAAAFRLDPDRMLRKLSTAPAEDLSVGIGQAEGALEVSVPTPEGALARFRVVETQILAPELSAQFPMIKTYAGVGVDDPTARIAMDLTPQGFHAQVLVAGGTYYVDPHYHLDRSLYAAYYRADAMQPEGREKWVCHVGHDQTGAARPTVEPGQTEPTLDVATGTTLRTYRMAVAATGEYTAFHGGTAALGLAAVTTAVNRLSQVYTNELTIAFQLVANNNLLIYTNAATDPFTNGNAVSMINQNQSNTDAVIGTANYDIGHVFGTAGSGLAGLGVVGFAGQKARGVSAIGSPIGDPFVVDYVAHEVGHQFGALHTFNNCGGGNDGSGPLAEPGSGVTIMAYAGICGGTNIASNSIPTFHTLSYDQILSFADGTIPGVGSRTATGNTPPTANGGPNYTIPANTPFTLTGSGTDANGDTLTYQWEQRDSSASAIPLGTDPGSGPIFRSFNPTTSPSRTFPLLSTILNGGVSDLGQRLPSTTRNLNFRFIVRDNRLGGGGVQNDDVLVASVNTGAAFAISNFNGSVSIPQGSTQTLNWNVSGTNGGSINTANVRITMSTDGGTTFPIELFASTPNDGSENFVVPNNIGINVRFRVAAIGNIFFDINNANITITDTAGVSQQPGQPTLAAVSDTGISNSDSITRLNNNGAGNVLQIEVPNTVSGATVLVFADGVQVGSAVAAGTTTTVTTNGTTILADGVRSIVARQTEPGKSPSANSIARSVTIDTNAPGGALLAFDRLVGPHQLQAFFNENVSGSLLGGDLVLTNTTGGTAPGTAGVSYNAGTNTATFTFPARPGGILSDGNYAASIPSANVTDVAGNPLFATPTSAFTFLAGDADNDRDVDIGDFAILGGNFNSAPRNFAQGDFNYSGTVEIGDFSLLAANFNVSFPPPASLPRPASVGTPPVQTGGSAFSDRAIADDLLAPIDDVLGASPAGIA